MELITTNCSSGEDRLEWDRFVLDHECGTGYHLYSWNNVISEVFGHDTIYLMVKNESGVVVGVAPLVILSSRLFGGFLVSLPFLNYGGILATNQEVRASLEASIEKIAIRKNLDHVELRQQHIVATSWISSERKVSMRLSLPSTYEELQKKFPSKLRSQVRRAQKEGMTTRIGGSECLDEFYAVFSRCMRDLGTPVYAKSFFAKILEVFPKEARICIVSHGGGPVAAGFLYGFRSSLEIPWAASDKRFNKLAPNMMLYGAVLEYACQ